MNKKLYFLICLLFIAAIASGDSEVSVGGKTGAAHIIQEEGTSLRPRPYLNFVGDAATCIDTGGKTECTFTGGSGSGGAGNSFVTWDTPSGTNIVAESTTDTVTFLEGSTMTITGGGAADTITIASSAATSLTGLTDVNSATADTGRLLVANGLNFDSVVMSGDITIGSSGLTAIGADKVKDTMVDWGTGAGQVSAVDIPIADAGGYFEGTEVETALAEAGYILTDITDDVALNKFAVTHAVDGAGVWTITITQPDGLDLEFNIDRSHLQDGDDVMSVVATAFVGTNAVPKTVYVYVDDNAGSPRLVATNTNPEGVLEHVDVARYRAGAITAGSPGSVNIYGGVATAMTGYEFIAYTFHRFFAEGSLYIDGLGVTATSTNVTIATGAIQTMFDLITTTERIVGTHGLFFIDSTPEYNEATDFAFTNYSTGEAIGANKFYNVVLGVMEDDDTRIMALVQGGSILQPLGKEYKDAKDCIADKYGELVLTPSDSLLKVLFVPVARICIKNDGSDELQEIPEPGTGVYYVDLRGQLGGGGGSVSLAGASQLTELSDVNSATATANRMLVANGTTFDSIYPNTLLAGTETSGVMTLGGVGGSNNENLLFDFETTANEVAVGTGTGVTSIDFGQIALSAASPVYNVKNFGAIGDFSNDDTAEIQAALDAAQGNGAGVVYVPEGTYLITDELDIYANTVLQGAGRYISTLKWGDAAGAMPGTGGASSDGRGLLNIRGVDNIVVRNLGIDCNEDNQSPVTTNTNGIYIWEADDIWIVNNYVQNVNAGSNGDMGNGVRINATDAAAGCQKVHVDWNHFTNINASNPIQMSMFPDFSSTNGNMVESSTHGIDWSTGTFGQCSFNTIREINSSGSNIAIGMTYATFMEIVGNVIENSSNGIYGHLQDATISGNFIQGKDTSTGAGIDIQGDSLGRNTISGNFITRLAIGIKTAGAGTNSTIVGNTITSSPIGIDLTGSSTQDLISGNAIKDATTNAIRLGASTDYINVIGNQTQGSSGAILNSGGSNTIITEAKAGTVLYPDSMAISFGTGTDAILQFDETQTHDSLQLGLNVANDDFTGVFSIMEDADMGNANRDGIDNYADPHFRVYSADGTNADDYIEMYHDRTDGVIDVGGGGIKFPDLSNCDTIDTDADGLLSCGDDATVAGSLTGLSDVNSATATAGNLLVANGTTFDSVAMGGDIGLDSTGDVTLENLPRCIVVENLIATDDNMSMGSFGKAVVIGNVWCHYIGTGSTVATITLEDGSGNAMTITDTNPTCTAHGTPPSKKTVTSANALTATELFRFDVSNTPDPVTDDYTICVDWK